MKYYFKRTDASSYPEMSSAAHSLLKSELSAFLGVPECEIVIEKNRLGKPFVKGLDDISVSLSHSHGTVMCAFSDTAVGADIELIRSRRESVEARVFTPAEISLINGAENQDVAFFSLWSLKESYLKAIGTGFAGNAKEIEFYTFSNPILSNKTDYHFEAGTLDGFAYAVCIKMNN